MGVRLCPSASKFEGAAMIRLTLPWPPSVNTIWRTWKGRHLLSKAGREYRQQVAGIIASQRVQGFGRREVKVHAVAYLPDRRRRDIDNLGKAAYDALQAARIFDDDSQVVDSHWVKGPVCRDNPRIEIVVEAA